VLVQQGDRDRGDVGVATVQGGLAHPGGGDLLHGDGAAICSANSRAAASTRARLRAAANVQLSAAMASPLGASTLQLGVGAVLLLALAAVAGSLGTLVLLDQAEPWHLVGGLGSAVYITAGILLFPRRGWLGGLCGAAYVT
jgi:uncharacterized membrane protein YdcZ (DUF606 family)